MSYLKSILFLILITSLPSLALFDSYETSRKRFKRALQVTAASLGVCMLTVGQIALLGGLLWHVHDACDKNLSNFNQENCDSTILQERLMLPVICMSSMLTCVFSMAAKQKWHKFSRASQGRDRVDQRNIDELRTVV